MSESNLPPIPDVLPVVPTTNLVVFPNMIAPLSVGRAVSLAAIDSALESHRMVVVTMQKDTATEEPGADDIHTLGCVCAILRMMRTPEGTAQVLLQGLVRARLTDIEKSGEAMVAHVETLPDIADKPLAVQALMNNLLLSFGRIVELSPILPDEALLAAQAQTNPGQLADMVASALNIEPSDRQALLELTDVQKRMERISELIANEISVLELTNQIQVETRKELDKGQRDFILRQQLREIQKQLGEENDGADIEELREQIEAAGMPPEVRKAADREIDRLSRLPAASPEHSVARNYLDYLISIPWSKSTPDNLNLRHAKQVLDDDHYGLDEVKDRIIEYLAVRHLKPDTKGPILCFVGPPGVGKTSLAKSIARALGRESVRMALGGVRDEAEIRGHRRTYIGALPGRIIQGLRDAGTNNPVMILDEIDKLGSDYRGDPTSALLEVLDPQQNDTFKDHYLEVPCDLSKVMFITTANVLDTIPPPLRDRMEIIRIPGYTEEEKVAIARRHLLPRQMNENGLEPENLFITQGALRQIARGYTREAGVRNLEREIGTVCRKAARRIAEAIGATSRENDGQFLPRPHLSVTAFNLEEYLDQPKIEPEMGGREPQIGVTTGMAWTPMGGEILFIETAKVGDKGGLVLTGQLGDVMKESAQIAFDYLRGDNGKQLLGKTPDGSSVHIHVPAGAIPKDGPSAGVAITAALASLLSNRPARHDIAMTGEVTLTGRVLPVGGIKEKVLAARQAGISTIILPERNRADIKDIPEATRSELKFEFVSDVRDAVAKVLLPAVKKGTRPRHHKPVTTPMEQDTDRTDPRLEGA